MDGHDDGYHGDDHELPDFWDDPDHSSDWPADDGHEHHQPWADHSPDDVDHGSEPESGFDPDLTPHGSQFEAPSHAADFSSEPDFPAHHEDFEVGDPAPHEPAIGADPDLPAPAHSSDAWLDLPDLHHLELPEPSGGGPWTDADLLGSGSFPGSGSPLVVAPSHPVGVLDDLRAALGEPSASDVAFERLLTSDDPAVRALAHLWRP